MHQTIQYTGTIERIDPPVVYVRIMQPPACSGCHGGSSCPVPDGKSRLFEVEDTTGNFALHEEVLLQGRYGMGMQAILLACVLPMAFVVAALGIAFGLTGDELTSGCIGLSVLLPCYGLIYLMRGKLNRKFVFTVSKIHCS
ncbi:MAG: SoxR reducing system RseC family protein [Tannerella sp.]|jgi:sigma-E factor negative regulatory protein RseC|nr:SoxR reducing system RseC family protein [Tannerella sp.]